jgi:hypothetical protein
MNKSDKIMFGALDLSATIFPVQIVNGHEQIFTLFLQEIERAMGFQAWLCFFFLLTFSITCGLALTIPYGMLLFSLLTMLKTSFATIPYPKS